MGMPENLTPVVEPSHKEPWWHSSVSPLSPFDGPLVRLFDGVWHADPITSDMLSEGAYIVYEDFTIATLSMSMDKGMASRAFNTLFRSLLAEAWPHVHPPGVSKLHPLTHYIDWGSSCNPKRRSELLLSTQKCVDVFAVRPTIATSKAQRIIRRVLGGMFDYDGDEPD